MQQDAPYNVKWSDNGQILVFDADTVMRLRRDHRLVGALEGCHPSNPHQNGYFGLPLILLPEETAYLLELNAIHNPPLTTHCCGQSLPDLHSRGYYLTRGLKYGADYLLYPGEPMRYHSSHAVTLVDHGVSITPRELITLGRLGTAVKKIRLLKFTHITMNWSAIG
ncbi:tRNA intron endonuclease [Kickxella alabastrina]|uniref:tRNA intron endonuclease n=1 Tax=Kickxella alabastrina TaxID=61397 RepID=UPI00221FE0FD|nr:tRNA intron endonuclease [Kickxella alabastrina]KAI7826681.1 tRNA intron endonuclease [Kickxella alabastrina]